MEFAIMDSPTTDIFSCTRLLQSGLQVSTPPRRRCGRRLILDENSPMFSKSPLTLTVNVRQRNLTTEDTDACSQDSAFSEGSFRFVQPSRFAPKRTESPRRCLKFSCENLSALSTDSGISEDGFSELPPPDEDSCPFPITFGTLLSGNFPTPKSRKRRSTPPNSASKRPKPLADRASEENKGNKGTLFQYGFTKNKAKPLVHSVSDSHLCIQMSLHRSTQEELIGDHSRPFALPLTPGKHEDLKAITSDTLATLINGGYDDSIASYKIIDCRYPYEYDGGHIKGAINLYTCQHILKDLLKSKPGIEESSGKRNILIFHCEYSSERGPFLSRFLRKEDRAQHANEYPQLSYPELYLLHGGYNAFFEKHKELCEPQSYRKMHDPAHCSEFKHFQAKSKSWAPGSHRKLAIRSLSRLNF